MTVTFITGGNTGLGYESAKRLKELGHKIYIGCRSEEKGIEAAKELGVEYIVIDVTNEDSVINAANEIKQKEGHIDVLINNAGIPGGYQAPKDITSDIMYNVFNTNVFGIVRVTHYFIPLLQNSKQPVIVNVSSGLGSFGQVLNPEKIESKVNALAYSSSKAAVSMLTVQYAKGMPNIRINAVDPGSTKTGEQFKNGTQTLQEGTDAIVKMATIGKDGPTGTFTNRDGIIPW
ncbi:SDR family NAD(P)-dependent oxidoreductase [Clostridioides difficile]|nr:SDR family NAD(P)-dependent oxidoreductase [Clostridioides difficile]